MGGIGRRAEKDGGGSDTSEKDHCVPFAWNSISWHENGLKRKEA